MKRVILTGATGFVGANLARRLVRDGHEAHLLVRPGYNAWRIAAIREHVRLHEVSLLDEEAISRTVTGIRPDWVFHLAVHGAYSWQTDRRLMAQTNFMGTMNLVEGCLQSGCEAFVNTGSSSEYGFKAHAPSETAYLEPNSYYAVTKAAATLFCGYVARSRGVRLPTLRLYSVYGPFEEPGRLMPSLIACAVSGRLPPLANPHVARDYVYVDDVVEAYLLAASQSAQEPGAVYNVGTGIQTSLRDVVDLARRVLGFTATPQWGSLPDRQWDTDIWLADSTKIRAELGWRPRYTFEAGFRCMVQWFRDNPSYQCIYQPAAVPAGGEAPGRHLSAQAGRQQGEK